MDLEENDLDKFIDEVEDDVIDSKKSQKKMKRDKKEKQNINLEADISSKSLQSLIDNASGENPSINSLKKLILIFRSACIPTSTNSGISHRGRSNEDDEDDEDNEDEPKSKSKSQFIINSPEIYELVMTTTIDNAHVLFYNLLGITSKDIPSSKPFSTNQVSSNSLKNKIEKHPKFKSIQLLLLSYFKSIMYTLQGLLDNMKQGQVSVLILSSLEKYIPLLVVLPRLLKSLLKLLLDFWSKELLLVEDVYNTRGYAFLRIRQMVIQMNSGSFVEDCFRMIYLTYTRTAKQFNENSYQRIIFMSQCIVELYQLDLTIAYQQGFLYIRQLALYLRTAILKKTSEALRQIATWQFLNCIRLWTRVVCLLSSNEEVGLQQLIFPLTQVILGVISNVSSLYYLPLRFHLITCLHQISAYCKVYIPISMKLIEILESHELQSKPIPSTDLPPNLSYLIKLPSESLSKNIVRDVIINQVFTLLRHNAEIYRYHVSFPEYIFIIHKKIKVFIKQCKVSKWRDIARTILSILEQYSQFALIERDKLGIIPKMITDFEALLPKQMNNGINKRVEDVTSRFIKLLSHGNINALSSVEVMETSMNTSKESKVKNTSINNKDESNHSTTNTSTNTNMNQIEKKSQVNMKKHENEKKKKGMITSSSNSNSNESDDLEDQITAFDWSDEDE